MAVQKTKLLLMLVAMALVGSASYVIWRGPAGGYLQFMRNDQFYYSRFADACDSILTQSSRTIAEDKEERIGQSFWPTVIQEAKAQDVLIGANRVRVIIGTGGYAFGVVWEPSYEDKATWELTTYAEGMRKVVFEEESRGQSTSWLMPPVLKTTTSGARRPKRSFTFATLVMASAFTLAGFRTRTEVSR